ncbi:MAG TPA: sigma-70 family RNA polymerase sigma factor [Chloroflexota bacterium]|nr:sigma-70 family RNA polymerase sigma factor [Chloroflexota bacterium]
MDASADVGEMIRRARAGDGPAFESIYRSTVVPIYRYVAARVDTRDLAEEVTQDVFFAAVKGIATFRGADENALLGWLFQIARHKIADVLRERYRRPVRALEDAAGLEDGALGPEEVALANGDRDEVRRALARLTDDQREVIVCKYILDYDNRRTAAIVGKDANAVNQLHHRALASLHRLLMRPRIEAPSAERS